MSNEINTNNQVPVQVPPMANPKHIRSFWPIVIVISVAFIAGLVVMYTISDSERQDDINSIFFTGKKVRKAPQVTPTPTPTIIDVMEKTGIKN